MSKPNPSTKRNEQNELVTLREITLPKGTIVKIGGIPLRLVNATKVESHPDNIAALEVK